MRHVEVSLVEFLDGREGGVRLLGRCNDPELVEHVRDHIARERQRDLDLLDRDHVTPPLRLVCKAQEGTDGED